MNEEHESPQPTQSEGKKAIVSRRSAVLAGLAGVAATALPDALHVERLVPPISDPRRIFEPGRHLRTKEEYKKYSEAFKNGDPDAHVWNTNPELVNRLASFSPQVLTMDGLSPEPTDEINKNGIWWVLPARPRRINQLGMYVVGGDNSYENIGEFYDNLGGKERGFSLEEYFSDTSSMDLKAEINMGVPAVSLLIGALIADTVKSKIEKKENSAKEPTQNKSVSRRTLLKGVALGSTALFAAGLTQTGKVLSGFTGTIIASHTKNEEMKKLWQSINSYINGVPDEVWVDGRTALLIAKHDDSMDYLRGKKYLTESARGAVVMGSSHDAKANLFMENKEARDEAILAYGKHILSAAHKFVDGRPGFDESARQYLDFAILTQLTATDIYHVSDPGIPPGTSLKQYIDSNVKKVDSFRSAQVKNALRSI